MFLWEGKNLLDFTAALTVMERWLSGLDSPQKAPSLANALQEAFYIPRHM